MRRARSSPGTAGRRPRLSLRALFILSVAAILLTTSMLLGTLLIRNWSGHLRSGLETRGFSLARTLASHAEYGLLVGDRQELVRLIDGLRHDPDLAWARISDERDQPLAEGPSSRAAPPPGPGFVEVTVPVLTTPVVRSREEVGLSRPSVSADGPLERIGSVTLKLSLASIDRALSTARWTVAAVTGLVLGVGLLLTVALASVVVGPVQALAGASRRIADGELEVQVPVASSLELAELASAFDHMVASLRERDRRLQEGAAELERRADALHARQTELQAANEALEARNFELRLSHEQLATVNAELVRASRLKSQFLASMSHELRTPLNSIIGYTDCLMDGLDGPINDEQRDSLERVGRNGRHLLSLINDILDLSKIESGRLELMPATIDPHALAGECLAMVRPLVRDKPVALSCELEPGMPTLHADAGRLRQVLINLLSNGVRFTGAGTVGLRICREEDVAVLSVHDTGPGIPADRLEEIFLEFRQLDARSAEGTGLGLAISRRLVDLMGGTLRVESEVGQGSVFTVRLPGAVMEGGSDARSAPSND